MRTFISNFIHEEDGITALEYGLLAAVVAGVIVLTVAPAIRTFFTDLFAGLAAKVTSALANT